MVKSEEITPVKVERGSPPRQERTEIHLFPEWATIQTFYSHGVPLHQPGFNPEVSDCHFPPQACLWTPPQMLIPVYGLPYPAHYSQWLFFAHPAAPLVSTPSKDSLSKSSDNADQGSAKKLRRVDEVVTPVGNNCAEFDTEASDHEVSQSIGIGASSDGSDGNNGTSKSMWRSHSTEPGGKFNVQDKVTQNSVHLSKGKPEPNVFCADEGLPLKVQLQEERYLKRERRKQANRESAQRSRLKKQSEFDEVRKRYETMKAENMALKSEVIQLTQYSDIVKVENATLMEKLNKSKSTRPNSDELLKLNNLCSVKVKEERVDA